MSGTQVQRAFRAKSRFGALACALVFAAGHPVAAQDQPTTPPKAPPTKAEQDAVAAKQQALEAEAAAATHKLQESQQEAATRGIPAPQRNTGQPGAAGQGRPGGSPTGSAGDPTGAAGRTNPGRSGLNLQGGNQTGNQGAGNGAAGRGNGQPLGPDEITLSAFSDAIELKNLVDYVADALQINIVASDTLTGSVVINAPVTIKKSDMIKFLDSLLEQQGFMIVRDDVGFYKVIPRTSTTFALGTTTRVIPTPGIRPSSLTQAINEQIGNAGEQLRLSLMDELGVIVITDTPRRIDAVSDLVQRVLERSQEQRFIRFDLQHVAASVMRQRVIDLLGASTTPGFQQPGQPNIAIAPGALQSGGPSTNLADRLTVDAVGNALIFRGYENEAERVRNVIEVLDRVNTLTYEQYYAGSAALQIAQLAEKLGLGHVEEVDTAAQSTQNVGFVAPGQGGRGNQVITQANNQANGAGGAVMVVDTARSNIIYYGTASQHAQLKSLIDKFDTEQELVTIRAYKILNQRAEVVADVLQGMVTGQATSSNSSFLPGGGGFFQGLRNQFGNNTQTNTGNRNTRAGSRGSTRTNQNNQNNNRFNQGGFTFGNFGNAGQAGRQGQPGQEGIDPLGGDNVFVIADPANNQVLVKAPGRQQAEFAKLINKLDQRRPQVYIEVQIVSVSSTDDFRLAFETQLINAGGTGGAVNTNFGLGSLTSTSTGTPPVTTGGFLSPKTVATGLAGLTAAIIKSDQVPLVITALKRDADTRILSSPQILVDDNEEAEIVSVDQQPTTQTTISTGNPTTETFGGYEEAGTTLLVTPSISEGGYMRLLYEIELSNFVGTGTGGIPAPKQVRNVRSNSVTIPGDTTIVVGGIKVDAKSNTVVKVPLLGDFPLVGHLFRDTNKNNATTRLYVFITPRIMRDAHFADLRLLTRGPRAEAELAPDIPPLEPVMIELTDPTVAKAPAPPLPPALPPENRERLER